MVVVPDQSLPRGDLPAPLRLGFRPIPQQISVKSVHGGCIPVVRVCSPCVIAKDTYKVLKTHASRAPPESLKN